MTIDAASFVTEARVRAATDRARAIARAQPAATRHSWAERAIKELYGPNLTDRTGYVRQDVIGTYSELVNRVERALRE